MSWIFLSYELSDEISGYGDGDRIKIKKSREICCGDSSNNTEFWMPTHFGTHMDFPFHFSQAGKSQSGYKADQFIFKNIFIQFLDLKEREDKLMGAEDFNQNYPADIDILIIKTYYSDLRSQEIYWKNNPGFQPSAAKKIKEKMPQLKAIAFDSISLTNFQNRELGRIAHKAFLMEQDILVIEDVNLSQINQTTKIAELIVSPLRMVNADGAPVTIFAKVIQ